MYVIFNDTDRNSILKCAVTEEDLENHLARIRSTAAEPEDIDYKWRDLEADVLMDWLDESPKHVIVMECNRSGTVFEIVRTPDTLTGWRSEIRFGPVSIPIETMEASRDNRSLIINDSVTIFLSDLDVKV